MSLKERINNKTLFMFLLKNGLISMVVSLIIVQTLLSMLHIDIHYGEMLPLFFFVLIINTIFFMIIFTQERKLRSHQEQLLAVIKNSSQAIFILDENRNIV